MGLGLGLGLGLLGSCLRHASSSPPPAAAELLRRAAHLRTCAAFFWLSSVHLVRVRVRGLRLGLALLG